jgi:hypothetical protein
VNFTFGLNPLGAHFSHKSKERIAIKGYWEDVENGWPQSHPNGYGMLGLVRGTLDGTPLDKDFPRNQSTDIKTSSDGVTDKIGLNAYATEGWATSNRGWLSTLIFSSLHSIGLRIVNTSGRTVKTASSNKLIQVELQAPLNVDPYKKDIAWVEQTLEGGKTERIMLTETDTDSGIFRGVLPPAKSKKVVVGYGYWGFRKEAVFTWN